MDWDVKTKDKFDRAISKLPVFHRRIAESAVSRRAQENALVRNSAFVEEADVVAAFFSDVPTPFYSMMIRLLEQVGLDYKKYGYPR